MDQGDGLTYPCPTCKGTGLCRREVMIEKWKEDSLRKPRSSKALLDSPYKPCIGTPKPDLRSPSKLRMKERIGADFPLLPSKIPIAKAIYEGDLSRSDSHYSFNQLMKRTVSQGSISEASELVVDLIGQEEVLNPVEHAKIVKALLTSSQWSEQMRGLKGEVALSRADPELALELARLACRVLLDHLSSLRSKCVRLACQAARELFKLGALIVFRPVFDEIVSVLLTRTSDSKRIIREDADEALQTIASHCPLQHVARACLRGVKQKHKLVRKSAQKMLAAMVKRVGEASLLRNNIYREVRGPILEAGCILLNDPIAEIRNSAKEMMSPIARMAEFDSVISEIDKNAFKNVEKILFNLSLGREK